MTRDWDLIVPLAAATGNDSEAIRAALADLELARAKEKAVLILDRALGTARLRGLACAGQVERADAAARERKESARDIVLACAMLGGGIPSIARPREPDPHPQSAEHAQRAEERAAEKRARKAERRTAGR